MKQFKLLRTDWYRDSMGKIAMATLHKVVGGDKTYYVINGDTLNPIVSQELAISIYLSSAEYLCYIPSTAKNLSMF